MQHEARLHAQAQISLAYPALISPLILRQIAHVGLPPLNSGNGARSGKRLQRLGPSVAFTEAGVIQLSHKLADRSRTGRLTTPSALAPYRYTQRTATFSGLVSLFRQFFKLRVVGRRGPRIDFHPQHLMPHCSLSDERFLRFRRYLLSLDCNDIVTGAAFKCLQVCQSTKTPGTAGQVHWLTAYRANSRLLPAIVHINKIDAISEAALIWVKPPVFDSRICVERTILAAVMVPFAGARGDGSF